MTYESLYVQVLMAITRDDHLLHPYLAVPTIRHLFVTIIYHESLSDPTEIH